MTLSPNAKINIGLNVVEKRPDGYHNIETLFYPIALCDKLTLEPSAERTPYRFSSSGITIAGNKNNNLIIKALNLLKKDFDIPSVDIVLEKNIPIGAGLGGGSADAAFMLKGLRKLCNLKISDEKLEEYAALLGADCPFFVRNRPVFATGTGNSFTPVTLSLKGYYLLLVKPDIYVSTPQAYSWLVPKRPLHSLLDSIALPVEKWKNLITNDFEQSVFSAFPELEKIKTSLYAHGALYAAMSGSGSALYGIYAEKPALPAAFDKYFSAVLAL